MTLQQAVVTLAGRHIRRVMRLQRGEVRATLPFDPDDPDDVRMWVKLQIENHAQWPELAKPAYIVKRLIWNAQKSGRRRVLRTDSMNGGANEAAAVVVLECSSAKKRAGSEASDLTDESESVQSVIACALGAADRICNRHRRTPRIASAMLSCLFRITCLAKSVLSPVSAGQFGADLAGHPQFRDFPVSHELKHEFMQAINRVAPTNNVRQSVKSAGWSSPGPGPWKNFLHEFALEWQSRFEINPLESCK